MTEKTDESSAVKDTVRYGFTADPGTLSPMRSNTVGFGDVTANIYDKLFYYDPAGNFVPSVCTEAETVDGTHYLLHLRDDVVFSDGHKLVADDVVYTLKMYIEAPASRAWVNYIDPENTRAVDDTTVELAMVSEYAFGLAALPNVNLFYQEAYEKSENGMQSDPIGSGPYVVKEYVAGSHVLFEARDDYWGGKPAIKNFKFMFITEPSQRTTSLMNKETDCVFDVPYTDYEDLLDAGFGGIELLTDKYYSLMFNCSEASICNNVKVRQAIAYATDNEGIFKSVFGGYGSVSKTCSSNGNVNLDDMYIPDDYYIFNMDKAKALLDEAGVKSGTELTIMVLSTNALAKSSAEVIQGALQELGLSVNIKQVDPAVADSMQRDPNSGWDAYFHFSTTAGSNNGLDIMNIYLNVVPALHYDDDEVKALAADAVSSIDKQIIHERTLAASKAVCENVPYYSVISAVDLIAYNPDLNPPKQIFRNYFGGLSFSWK